MKKIYMLIMLFFTQTKAYAQAIIFKNLQNQTIFTCYNSNPKSCKVESTIDLKNKSTDQFNLELASALKNGNLNDFLMANGVLRNEFSAEGVMSKTCGTGNGE